MSLLDGYEERTLTVSPASPLASAPHVPTPHVQQHINDAVAMQGAGVRFVVVPQRLIAMGMDIKFEEDPMLVKLGGLIKADDYTHSICAINNALKECRHTNLDHALLAMGPAMLPLIPWAIRSKQHKQMRRKIMQRCVSNFNTTNTLGLVMRWQTRPIKELTIWRREAAEEAANA